MSKWVFLRKKYFSSTLACKIENSEDAQLSEEFYHRDDHMQMIEARLRSAGYQGILSQLDDDLPPQNEDWQSFVCDSVKKLLTEDDKSQQDAIWELIQTEVSFIRKMRTMITIFIHTVREVLTSSDCVLLHEVSVERLFTNIEDVYSANLSLWRTHMLPIYEKLKKNGNRMDPVDLKPAFLNFAEILKPYFTYVIDQNSCTEYFKSLYKNNEVFRRVIEWCEARSSERLSFLDLFIQPMQRLTKYKLLLEAIHKRSTDEQESMHLMEMVASVDCFVKATNAALRCQEQFYSLTQIMQRSSVYEGYQAPVELQQLIQDKYGNNSRLNLLSKQNDPDRTLVHHGILKMKETKEKIDVYCYLLSDMFIILRWRKNTDKLKFVRSPVQIDNIDVHNLSDDNRGTFALIIKKDFDFVDAGLLFFSHQSRYWVKCIEAVKRDYLLRNNPVMDEAKCEPSISTDSVLYSFQNEPNKSHIVQSNKDLNDSGASRNQSSAFSDTRAQKSLDQTSNHSTLSDIGSYNSSSLFVRLERPRLVKQNSTSACCSSNFPMKGGRIFRPLTPSSKPGDTALKRDDSIMSNCSKKSSSGVSSSNSSLIHTLEEL